MSFDSQTIHTGKTLAASVGESKNYNSNQIKKKNIYVDKYAIMKKLFISLLPILILSCDKNPVDTEPFFTARVVDYDYNCSTCILSFPNDSSEIIRKLGNSENNCYHAVNLDMESFIIGQEINVQLREARIDEIKPCIELYVDYDYKDVYITNYETLSNLSFNDTISINTYECLVNTEKIISICLDSVINDSRCPSGAVCVWEGDAVVSFSVTVDNETKSFELHTNSKFCTDTLINGYNIALISLLPYPSVDFQIDKEDYSAKIILIDK